MTELLEQIDKLVTDIQSDTTRSKLPQLSELLIQLSVKLGESKSEYIRAKNKYEREMVMKKEQWEQYLTKQVEERYLQELENNPKAKKEKVTNAEIERLAELELVGLKDEIAEPQATSAYLEPILRAYQDLINSWKWIGNNDI